LRWDIDLPSTSGLAGGKGESKRRTSPGLAVKKKGDESGSKREVWGEVGKRVQGSTNSVLIVLCAGKKKMRSKRGGVLGRGSKRMSKAILLIADWEGRLGGLRSSILERRERVV